MSAWVPPGGGACDPARRRRLARPGTGTVGRVAEDVAVPHAADAWRWGVPVLATLVALFALVSNPGTPTENLVAGAAVVPFVLWAWRPPMVPTLALVVIVAAAQFAAQRSGDLEPLLFLVAIASAIVGSWEPSRWAAVVAATLAAATPFVVEVVVDDDIVYGLWTVGVLLLLLLGRVSRWQLRLAAELAEARQELARQAATEEKRRIARDVHDLVGHGLAAMLLHVTGARHVLRRDPDQADPAMADAEAVGRRSMEELRRTLHLLRAPQAEPVAEPPLPAAGDIAAAVETARAVGVDAEFRLVGDLGRIDPIVGLSLHRVAEEALANARRHAPRAVTDVVLTVEPEGVVLTVDSVGPVADGKPEDPDRPCYGIVGMRERMGSIGGDLEAGPTATGWSVRCRAPLTSTGQDR
ncbi:MAG: integral rane sensor signal transduction histidine kinase [Desertimonas sp.]|nr:integral rane sensor signal transduction histidine kinase [Desertimonas sp.]